MKNLTNLEVERRSARKLQKTRRSSEHTGKREKLTIEKTKTATNKLLGRSKAAMEQANDKHKTREHKRLIRGTFLHDAAKKGSSNRTREGKETLGR